MLFKSNAERLAVLQNLESLFSDAGTVRMTDFNSKIARTWFSPQNMEVSLFAFKRHLELGVDKNTPDHVFFGKIRPDGS